MIHIMYKTKCAAKGDCKAQDEFSVGVCSDQSPARYQVPLTVRSILAKPMIYNWASIVRGSHDLLDEYGSLFVPYQLRLPPQKKQRRRMWLPTFKPVVTSPRIRANADIHAAYAMTLLSHNIVRKGYTRMSNRDHMSEQEIAEYDSFLDYWNDNSQRAAAKANEAAPRRREFAQMVPESSQKQPRHPNDVIVRVPNRTYDEYVRAHAVVVKRKDYKEIKASKILSAMSNRVKKERDSKSRDQRDVRSPTPDFHDTFTKCAGGIRSFGDWASAGLHKAVDAVFGKPCDVVSDLVDTVLKMAGVVEVTFTKVISSVLNAVATAVKWVVQTVRDLMSFLGLSGAMAMIIVALVAYIAWHNGNKVSAIVAMCVLMLIVMSIETREEIKNMMSKMCLASVSKVVSEDVSKCSNEETDGILASILLGLTSAQDWSKHKLKAVSDSISKFPNVRKGIGNLSDMVVNLFHRFSDALFDTNFTVEAFDDKEFRWFVDQCKHWRQRDEDAAKGITAAMYHTGKFLVDKYHTYETLESYKGLPQHQQLYLRKSATYVHDALQGKYAHFAGQSSRAEPVCIYLDGLPGVGKSVIIDLLTAYFCKKLIPDFNPEEFSRCKGAYQYNRQVENEFHEGYHGQLVTVVDDIGQKKDVKGGTSEWFEIIRMVNCFPLHLHMAAMEKKSNTYFTSPIIILTSNNPIPVSDTIMCPAALYRRFTLCYQVIPALHVVKEKARPGNVVEYVLDKKAVQQLSPSEAINAYRFCPYTPTADYKRLPYKKALEKSVSFADVCATAGKKLEEHANMKKRVDDIVKYIFTEGFAKEVSCANKDAIGPEDPPVPQPDTNAEGLVEVELMETLTDEALEKRFLATRQSQFKDFCKKTRSGVHKCSGNEPMQDVPPPPPSYLDGFESWPPSRRHALIRYWQDPDWVQEPYGYLRECYSCFEKNMLPIYVTRPQKEDEANYLCLSCGGQFIDETHENVYYDPWWTDDEEEESDDDDPVTIPYDVPVCNCTRHTSLADADACQQRIHKAHADEYHRQMSERSGPHWENHVKFMESVVEARSRGVVTFRSPLYPREGHQPMAFSWFAKAVKNVKEYVVPPTAVPVCTVSCKVCEAGSGFPDDVKTDMCDFFIHRNVHCVDDVYALEKAGHTCLANWLLSKRGVAIAPETTLIEAHKQVGLSGVEWPYVDVNISTIAVAQWWAYQRRQNLHEYLKFMHPMLRAYAAAHVVHKDYATVKRSDFKPYPNPPCNGHVEMPNPYHVLIHDHEDVLKQCFECEREVYDTVAALPDSRELFECYTPLLEREVWQPPAIDVKSTDSYQRALHEHKKRVVCYWAAVALGSVFIGTAIAVFLGIRIRPQGELIELQSTERLNQRGGTRPRVLRARGPIPRLGATTKSNKDVTSLNHLLTNLGTIGFLDEMKLFRQVGRCFCVKGDFYVTSKHVMEDLAALDPDAHIVIKFPVGNDVAMLAKDIQGCLALADKDDENACFARLSGTCEYKPNKEKAFLPNDFIPQSAVFPTASFMWDIGDVTPSVHHLDSIIYENFVPEDKVHEHVMLQDLPIRSGESGRPSVTFLKGRPYVVGIGFGRCDSTGECISMPVNLQFLDDWQQRIEEARGRPIVAPKSDAQKTTPALEEGREGFTKKSLPPSCLPALHPGYYMPDKSKIVPSRLGHYLPPELNTTAPASFEWFTHPEHGLTHPEIENMRYKNNPQPFDVSQLVMIADELIKRADDHAHTVAGSVYRATDFRRRLEFEEAIEGRADGLLKSMPKDTSPGYDFNTRPETDTRKKFFGHGDKPNYGSPNMIMLREMVESGLADLDRGVLPTMFNCVYLKDELRDKAKVESHSTRLIEACNLAWFIIMRMLFGNFVVWWSLTKIFNGTAIGVNPYSEDWDLIYALLTRPGFNLFDGDYKSWDHTIPSDFFFAVFLAVAKWYGPQHYAARVACAQYYTHAYRVITIPKPPKRGTPERLLWDDLPEWDFRRQTFVAYLMRACVGMCSGNFLTACFNSIAGGVIIVLGFQLCTGEWDFLVIWEQLYFITQGDDHVVGTRHVAFTARWFGNWLSTFGCTYTAADKSAEISDWTPIEKVTFLKRRFVPSKVRRSPIQSTKTVLAPLNEASIWKQLYWRKSNIRESEYTNIVIETFKEAALHGKQFYDQYVETVFAASKRAAMVLPYYTHAESLSIALRSEAII